VDRKNKKSVASNYYESPMDRKIQSDVTNSQTGTLKTLKTTHERKNSMVSMESYS
jgi:hypothetical protein